MNKLVIIVIAALLLAGAGVGAWVFVQQGEGEADAAEPAEPEEPVEPLYVEFNPIQLPVLRDDAVEQLVTFVVTLEVADELAGDRVIALAPRLNDALMLDLYGALDSRSILMANGVVDVARLKDRIVRQSAAVLGNGVVTDVLVQMITQRPQQR